MLVWTQVTVAQTSSPACGQTVAACAKCCSHCKCCASHPTSPSPAVPAHSPAQNQLLLLAIILPVWNNLLPQPAEPFPARTVDQPSVIAVPIFQRDCAILI